MSEQRTQPHIRRFTAQYCDGDDGVVTHGHGVVWPDGQVALHWHPYATLCFKDEAELRQAYRCEAGCTLTVQFIDEAAS